MKILVTGASGFIGGRFALHALQQGFRVRINGRNSDQVRPLIEAGAEFIGGDLSHDELAQRLCQGVDQVVHCAGAVGTWGSYAYFYQANVGLTERVISACLAQKVERLVHLSSPSVYFDGQSHIGLREEQLPKRFVDYYGETKHLAEQRVLQAQQQGLQVIALRPRFVVGAGDRSVFPRLIAMQQRGRLMMIGSGRNQVDFTCVENLNQALLSSLQANEQALGKVYNISNGQPYPLWPVINQVLQQLGLPPVSKRMPFAVAHMAASLNEWACRYWPGQPEPRLYRLGVAVMARDFSLDISRAKQLLNYQPRVSLETGLDEFCQWWRTQSGVSSLSASG